MPPRKPCGTGVSPVRQERTGGRTRARRPCHSDQMTQPTPEHELPPEKLIDPATIELREDQGRVQMRRREAEADWQPVTLVRLFPKTGRRHQLRVHLEAIGHPILGDPLYGHPDDFYLARIRGEADPRVAAGEPGRLLLHCERLVFPDPNGPGNIDVRAALPRDMRDL